MDGKFLLPLDYSHTFISQGADLVLSVLVTLSLIGLAEVGYAILALIFYGVKYLLTRLK